MSDDNTLDRAPHLAEWVETMSDLAERFGKPLKIGIKLKGWMTDAGFEDIHDEIHKVSNGTLDDYY